MSETVQSQTRGGGIMLPGLRDARANAAMTLKDLEAASGVPTATINKLELLRRGAIPRTAGRLAQALGVSVRELREGERR